ncbi:hypothetical protein B0H63DRAFT_110862 [Podospora didyma]|uniref:B30.2/SPRY domain-containing protein n=1 Tax=Podospora didyma TaxID=330526 RepID=A0AAE0NYY5_9PEZI|nr:hypothetical protein B0H63DRAFT_110862 [Podospora didyma]
MATEIGSPKGESTPGLLAFVSAVPQKRVLEDDHIPAVSSPLNPDVKPVQKFQSPAFDDIQAAMSREKRTKKDSLKKREAKGGAAGPDSSRATPDPKQQHPQNHHEKDAPASELAPMRYKLAPPKPSDFEQSRGPLFQTHHEVQVPDGRTIEFLETSEHVYNKKNFHYTHCIADPAFPSMFYYRQTEPEPYTAHLNFEDAAAHMYFDRAGGHVTSDKGFRMTRANVSVREGRWFWECKVTRGILKTRAEGDPESHGHIRVGFARREASLDAPVGFDAYSYGIRDVAGQKVHMSRPKDFLPPGEDIREGDVIGLEIQLPSEHLHRKVVQGQFNPAVDLLDEESDVQQHEAPNIVRDRIPIRFKAHIYFEKIDYHTSKELDDLMNPSPMGTSGSIGSSEPPNPNHPLPPLRTLPNSHIKVYKNGVLMGTPWTHLLAFLPPASKLEKQAGGRECLDDGSLGYYPAVSVFRGGAVETNFGPKFWYPPPGLAGYTPSSSQQTDDVDMIDVHASPPVQTATVSLTSVELQPVSERYDEQIVEDIVYDIIDEVGFWMQDGGKVVDRTVKDEKAGELAGQIKELVQDD